MDRRDLIKIPMAAAINKTPSASPAYILKPVEARGLDEATGVVVDTGLVPSVAVVQICPSL